MNQDEQGFLSKAMKLKAGTTRTVPVLTGLVLMIVAALIYWQQSHVPDDAIGGPHHPGSGWLIAVAPMTMVCGAVILARGAIWGSRVFSPRTVLVCGAVMLALGGYPWIYTGAGEGGGMLGTLLFLSLGIPGVVFTLSGLLLGGRQKDA